MFNGEILDDEIDVQAQSILMVGYSQNYEEEDSEYNRTLHTSESNANKNGSKSSLFKQRSQLKQPKKSQSMQKKGASGVERRTNVSILENLVTDIKNHPISGYDLMTP